MGEYLPQLLLAWSIQWAGIMSPGPGVMLILSVATTGGRGAALLTALGIGLAAILLALATVLGLAALLAKTAILMTAVKFIGAGYLLWMAYSAFRKAANPPQMVTASQIPAPSRARLLLAGFTMQISNPKAILFWVAIAAVGGIAGAPLPIMALFIAGAFVNSLLGHVIWAVLLSSSPIRAGYARARRPIEAALGIFFLGFAAKLATTKV
ncbi:threonine transporter [Rhodobacterales bacterium 59_46_T64]|nr:threonine transporter [Rhodobacterales bacterium 59_46_T64]